MVEQQLERVVRAVSEKEREDECTLDGRLGRDNPSKGACTDMYGYVGICTNM